MDLSFVLKDLPNGGELVRDYRRDMKTCERAGEKESDCANQVRLKYLRQMPGLKDTVYPWSNYDWDYRTFVDNNYNTQKTGITKDGTFEALLWHNPTGAIKLSKGYVFDPNPSNHSKSSYNDVPHCFSSLDSWNECQENNVVSSIRQSYNYLSQKPPYPDPFFTKHGLLDGRDSSSYYIRTGVCPKPNMDMEECKKRGWAWVGNPIVKALPKEIQPSDSSLGGCFKPKYGFVKNRPGIKIDFATINEMNRLMNKGIVAGTGLAGTVGGTIAGNQIGLGGAGGAVGGTVGAGIAKVGTGSATLGLKASEAMINKSMGLFQGAIPSLINGFQSISPVDVYIAAKGGNLPAFENMDCNEGFGCPKPRPDSTTTIYQVILVFILIITVILTLTFFKR